MRSGNAFQRSRTASKSSASPSARVQLYSFSIGSRSVLSSHRFGFRYNVKPVCFHPNSRSHFYPHNLFIGFFSSSETFGFSRESPNSTGEILQPSHLQGQPWILRLASSHYWGTQSLNNSFS